MRAQRLATSLAAVLSVACAGCASDFAPIEAPRSPSAPPPPAKPAKAPPSPMEFTSSDLPGLRVEHLVSLTTRDGQTLRGRLRDLGDELEVAGAQGKTIVSKADVAQLRTLSEGVPTRIPPALLGEKERESSSPRGAEAVPDPVQEISARGAGDLSESLLATNMARIRGELDRLDDLRRESELPRDLQLAAKEERILARGRLEPLSLEQRQPLTPIALDEYLRAGLGNNLGLLVALIQADVTREGIPRALATFDPALQVQGTLNKQRQPNLAGRGGALGQTGITDGISVGSTLSQRLPLGTSLSLAWVESRQDQPRGVPPTYQPSLTFQVNQPLLRGAGLQVNLAPIEIARLNAEGSDADYVRAALQAVLTLESAYWDVVLAEWDLRVQHRNMSGAIAQYDSEKQRLRARTTTQLSLLVARSGVAQRRENIINAETNLEASRDQLLRLAFPASDAEKWRLRLAAVELPQLEGGIGLDVGAAVARALNRRPDHYRALLNLEVARKNLLVAENGALPAVNLVGSWKAEGLGRQHHSGWTRLGSGRFYTWSMGVEVELPLLLRSERAQLRAARKALQQAEASLRDTEAQVVLEVRTAIRQVRSAFRRIDAARRNRRLLQERLDATRELVRAGRATNRFVQDDLSELAAAESAEMRAYVDYRLALTRLRVAEGTSLDPWLGELDPRVRRILERRARLGY